MEFRFNFKLGVAGVVAIAILAALYYKYRHKRQSTNSYIPLDFNNQIELGFRSDNFDTTQNVSDGDSRQGLDVAELREIQHLMKTNKLSFDQARLKRMEYTLTQNDIDESGLPRDPKFVQFSKPCMTDDVVEHLYLFSDALTSHITIITQFVLYHSAMESLLRKLSVVNLAEQTKASQTPIHLRDGNEFWEYLEKSSNQSSHSTPTSALSIRWSSDSIPPPVYSLPKIHLSYADKVKFGRYDHAEALQNEFEKLDIKPK
ncbi:hypothetical protein E3P99_01835 [Wallemia hederae]|uniref:Uncharacterized protein n=1 Tax=Wallemia hederae TaxID=1540922 RepID=A0A4T0FNH0_9BASI|nr:hypothetical protein E3P99_01835 [Wallemia hederae]